MVPRRHCSALNAQTELAAGLDYAMTLPLSWSMKYSNAIENNDLEGVKEAVAAGVSVESIIDDGHDSNGLMHSASEGYYEIAEFLLKEGASPNVIQWSRTPAIAAKSAGFLQLAELIHSYAAPAISPNAVASKAELFAPDGRGNAFMDHPDSWQNFDRLVVRLHALGEHITKDDLMAENSRGVPWIEKAAMHGELDRVMQYLGEIEQPLTLADLVQDGAATPLLESVAWHGQAGALFREDDWEDRNPHELTTLYRALPEEAKLDVTNYHALSASLARTARHLAREEGREREISRI